LMAPSVWTICAGRSWSKRRDFKLPNLAASLLEELPMTTRVTLILLGAALSVAACAVAPIGSAQQDGSDTGASSTTSKATKKDGTSSELETTPIAASTTSCTNLKACAARVTGADATTFAKVAGEGDGDTCTKALAQCTSELSTTTTVVDAGTPTPPTPPAAPGCTALSTCCDELFDADNADYMTCDTVVANAVESSCGVSLSAFQSEGTCF